LRLPRHRVRGEGHAWLRRRRRLRREDQLGAGRLLHLQVPDLRRRVHRHRSGTDHRRRGHGGLDGRALHHLGVLTPSGRGDRPRSALRRSGSRPTRAAVAGYVKRPIPALLAAQHSGRRGLERRSIQGPERPTSERERKLMIKGLKTLAVLLMAGTALVACSKKEEAGAPAPAAAGDSVKVGVLHSLTGTMAISEVTVKNSTQMAIDEINAAGGVLGKQIEAVVEDGASDPAIFAQKATKLTESDKVATA